MRMEQSATMTLALIGAFFASLGSGYTETLEKQEPMSDVATNPNATIEFTDAVGRPLGSVTTIGGTTYYAAPDGTLLGTSSIVDGLRIFKTYETSRGRR